MVNNLQDYYYDSIKPIQELVKEKGLQNATMFRELMAIDTEENTKIFDYYNSIKGKCFIKSTAEPTSLLHGHTYITDVHQIVNVSLDKGHLNIGIKVGHLGCYNNSFTAYYRQQLTQTPTVGAYIDWREIDEEVFNTIYETCKTFADSGQEQLKKYYKEFKS